MSVFLILSLILPNTLANDYVVCDELGWTLGVDIKGWLSLNTFRVGDTLRKSIDLFYASIIIFQFIKNYIVI